MALALPTGPRGRALALGVTVLAAAAVWAGVIAPAWDWYDDRAELLRRQHAMAHRMALLVETLPALRREASRGNAAMVTVGKDAAAMAGNGTAAAAGNGATAMAGSDATVMTGNGATASGNGSTANAGNDSAAMAGSDATAMAGNGAIAAGNGAPVNAGNGIAANGIAAVTGSDAAAMTSNGATATGNRTDADTPASLLTGATDPLAAAALQQRIEEFATQAGVRVGSEEILPSRTEGDLRAISVRLTMTAPFDSVVALLLALARSEIPMVVDELQLRGPPGKSGADELPVDANLTVTSYRLAKVDAR